MSAAASKLNLRPQEKRLLAFVLIVVFVVLNVWLVWPHFGDWSLIKSRQERSRKTYQSYQAEIAKTSGYRVKLRELESAGSSVVPEEQELDLVRRVDGYAQMARLNVIQSVPRAKDSSTTQTNRFFEEQSVSLHATSGNEELVNFLVSLTSTNSLIRVKDLTVKLADASGTRLDANMTLVASYQRKTPAKGQPSAASVAPTTSPGARPSPAAAATSAKTPAAAPPKITTTRTNRAAARPATNTPARTTPKSTAPPARGTNATSRRP